MTPTNRAATVRKRWKNLPGRQHWRHNRFVAQAFLPVSFFPRKTQRSGTQQECLYYWVLFLCAPRRSWVSQKPVPDGRGSVRG